MPSKLPPERLVRSLTRLAAPWGRRLSIYVADIEQGWQWGLRAEEPFPMASVFKVPILATLYHEVAEGRVSLEERHELRDEDQSIGSTLIHLAPGTSLTLRDYAVLMITLSDNTATDIVWRRIGLPTPNAYLKSIGLGGIDCSFPNREYYLLSVGYKIPGLGGTPREVIAQWRALTPEERWEALARFYDAHRGVTPQEFLRRTEALYGVGGERRYAEQLAFDQALDNRGPAAQIGELLSRIVRGEGFPSPLREDMLEILHRQEFTNKLPDRLPPGIWTGNKTGGVTGTSNDAAIFRIRRGRHLVLVGLSRGLRQGEARKVTELWGRVGLAAYEAAKRLR